MGAECLLAGLGSVPGPAICSAASFAPDGDNLHLPGRPGQKTGCTVAWRSWQQRAGFDRLYPFHCARHSAVTNVYRATRDLFLVQRFARHVSPLTTTVYTHPSDDEARSRLRGLPC